jgi:CheY-like chemotaxis protein
LASILSITVPKKVLLADDSATIQRVVELTFAGEDVAIVSVPDGDQAVAAIRQSPPDLVLADIGMPGRTGYEVAEFVRSQPALSSLPVLLLAGAFEQIDEARARRVGAAGILTKPFEPAVLVGRVRELLEVGRTSAPLIARPPQAASPFLRELTSAAHTADAAPHPKMDSVVPQVLRTEGPPAEETRTAGDVSSERRVPTTGGVSETDRYFAEIDEAFAALSKRPRQPISSEREAVDAPQQPEPDVVGRSAAKPPDALPLTDAFVALLDAEQTGVEVSIPAAISAAAPAIDINALADQIVRRVLEQLSDRAVREAVADIVGATAERLVREEIEQIKRNIK